MTIDGKEQVEKTNDIFIDNYLVFKKKCIDKGITDINEIIKLFEVVAS